MQEKRQAVQRQLQELSQRVKQLELEKAELRGALGNASNKVWVCCLKTPCESRRTRTQHLPVSLLKTLLLPFALVGLGEAMQLLHRSTVL